LDLRSISACRACASASALSAAGISRSFDLSAGINPSPAVPDAEFNGVFSVIAIQEANPPGYVKPPDALLKYVTGTLFSWYSQDWGNNARAVPDGGDQIVAHLSK